jgi:hypothetical protein
MDGEGWLRSSYWVQFLNAGDVEEGAFDESPGDGILVRVNADFERVAFHQSRIVICDVVLLSIRHVNAERLERVLVQALFEVQGSKHISSLSVHFEFSTSLSHFQTIIGTMVWRSAFRFITPQWEQDFVATA